MLTHGAYKRESTRTFDEEHDTPGLLELADELLEAERPDDLGALGLVLEERLDLVGGAIVGAHDEAVVVHVQDEILAHHRQPDQADIGDSARIEHMVNGYYVSVPRKAMRNEVC